MNWIEYSGLFILLIISVFCIVAFATNTENSSFFDKYNSDAMKGIAILAVILCHFMGAFGKGITLFTPLGGIGVSIFLMLSGFGLNESNTKVGYYGFWSKRIIAVFIPYIILQIVLYWPFHDFALLNFLGDITLIKPLYYNGWYLNYIFICYTVFYLVVRIKILRKYKIPVLLVLSIVSFFMFREIKAEQAFSFFSGVLISEYKESEKIEKLVNWKSGIALLIIGGVALAMKQTSFIRLSPQILYNLVQLFIKLPSGFGICCLIVSFSKRLNIRLLVLIGNISYELYLIHGYVLTYVPISIFGEILFIIGSFGGAVLLHMVLKWVKKPCMKLLRVNR